MQPVRLHNSLVHPHSSPSYAYPAEYLCQKKFITVKLYDTSQLTKPFLSDNQQWLYY